MGSKAKAPPPPDYTPIAAASAASSEMSFRLGMEQLNWAKHTYTQDKEIVDQVVSGMISDMEANQRFAEMDRERYERVFQPLEDALSRDALTQQQRYNDLFRPLEDAYVRDANEARQRYHDIYRPLEDQQVADAKAARERYHETFRPMEDALVADVERLSSEEHRLGEMGRAQSNVAQHFEAARQNAQRELESYGINPSATRFAALDIGVRTQQAAAQAAAGTEAGRSVDDQARAVRADAINLGRAGIPDHLSGVVGAGRHQYDQTTTGAIDLGRSNHALLSESINIGRGYPGQVAGAYGTSLQAGTGAVNSTHQQTATGTAARGSAVPFINAGNQALGVWGNALNMGHNNALGTFNANQSRSSGWGTALGLVGGIGMKAMGFNRGGVVPHYAEGGAIPEHLSPTGGAIPDDVDIKATPGEFVMPDEAVKWHGEKAMYGLIEKAAKERAEAKQRTGAVPQAIPMGAH